MDDQFSLPAIPDQSSRSDKYCQSEKENDQGQGKRTIVDVFYHPVRADIDFGYEAIVMAAVGCIVRKMGLAQMGAGIIAGMDVAMMVLLVVQIMDMQPHSLRA